MRRFTQSALLGAVILLSAVHLDRLQEATPKPAPRVEASADVPSDRLTTREIEAFLVRNRIPHEHLALVPLAERVNQAARRNGLDPAVVLAVIGVESTFRPAAISHKGALGLMQILPNTGQELAAEMGVSWEGDHALLEPDLNIELGAYYLRKLLDRFDGDLAAALEAYNVGPARLAMRQRTEPEAPFRYASRVLPYWEEIR